ncbi:MAG: hypothetical protein IKM77_12615 [Prevotella sp.]|nr:hypothetical protein [Prevotella sp.]
MKTRFKKKINIFNVAVTAISGMLSVSIMFYAVGHFGLSVAWPELVLNTFYVASLVMMWMYFFNRLETQQFNYWSSVCLGITVLLRDILFPLRLVNYPLHLSLDEATGYLMTEIWIRPTITYGLVACFVTETNEK